MSSQAANQISAAAQSALGARAVIVDGEIRPYILSLPRNYNPGRAYPVIFGFGGWQNDAIFTRSYQRLENAAGDRAIVVYAQGVNNSWGGAPYASRSMQSDIRYVRAVVDNVGWMHKIDRQRIYAAGFSNGGGMAAALACHAPDLVAGVATVAGAFYNPTVTNCAPGHVDTLIMHAEDDNVINYNGGVRHGAAYRSAPSVHEDFSRRNRTELQKYTSGGHSWLPGATDRAVRFFLG